MWPRTARISRSEEDPSGWTFNSDLPNELSFEKPMITTLRIATSGTTGPEGAEGVLALEVTVTALDE